MKKSALILVCIFTLLFAGCNKTTPVNNTTTDPGLEVTDTAKPNNTPEANGGDAADKTAEPEGDIGGEGESTEGEDTENPPEQTDEPQNTDEVQNTPEPEQTDSGLHHVEIDVKDYGTIKLELDANSAPITVENFLKLTGDGFYDGLTFHRIIDGFMVQGGDPQGDGYGGSEDTITGEFAENGIENNISHVRGVISMARSSLPNSASSQFFIVHEDSTFLDGKYAAFGRVTEGIEVVDALCTDVAGWGADGNGMIPAENQPVISAVRVID